MESDECSVCVAVHVRPLIEDEEDAGCRTCLAVAPDEPQVSAGPHSFRYDYVFGGDYGQSPALLFDKCVEPLVDGLFRGYNATVFAYGQTGSGKTYTMGSAFSPGGSAEGVIPKVMEAIFEKVSKARDVDFTVRVGFVEIHKDDIKDLLLTDAGPHPHVHIREVVGGGVCLAGAHEREVRTKEQMVEVLQQGTLLRATAATGMNKRSSRSHAIFTITLEQRKLLPPATAGSLARQDSKGVEEENDEEADSDGEQDGLDDSYLCAKMHLVDLAGSERAKRTKAVGQRLQEGININKGLLALGNVICALSEGKQHVPYRDSKLTRMLQDSLGGNSRTVMIACVSPADVNMEETLNTLRYANRARNIRNKPVVNRDPVAAQIAHMRQQLAAAKAENQALKRKLGMSSDGGLGLFDGGQDLVMAAALEELEHRNKQLDMKCNRLRVESESLKQDLTEATEKMIVAQAQRDKLAQKLEQVAPEAAEEVKAALGALAGDSGEVTEAVSHLQRIAELEREVKRLRQVSRVSGAFVVRSRRQSLALEASSPGGAFSSGHPSDAQDEDTLSDMELHDDEFAAEEQAHRHEMTRVQAQIAQLQQQLEDKEARMHVVGSHALMKHAYDKQLKELQQEVEQLTKERIKLAQEVHSLQHASEEERAKMEVQYRNRLRDMDDKLKSLRSKEKKMMELERLKGKAEEACTRLQTDILSIKQQKVSLIKQMERSAKEFAEWKRARDKELLQLRKQGRANAVQLHKMEALHEKQQAVLRRKTEEAEAARKRLKELEQRRSQAISRPATAAADRPTTAPTPSIAIPPRPSPPAPLAAERSASVPSGSPLVDCLPNQAAPLLRDEKSKREWVESELDACCASYDLQRVLEGEKALRSECARKLRDVERKLAALKNPGWWPASMSPDSKSEKYLLKHKQDLHRQLDAHSKQIQEFQLQLMKAKQSEEEKGGGAADARRWNGLRSIVEARAMLKTVFRSASQHKAHAYEAQLQMTEAVEEVELLRLRLDISEQEKLEQANMLAKAQAAAAAAAVMAADSSSAADAAPVLERSKDDTDVLADSLIQQLDAMPSNLLETIPEEASFTSSDEEEDGFDSQEESDEESSSDEEADRWDPSKATPFQKRKKGTQSQQPEQATRSSRRSSAGGAPSMEEQPVINFINDERRKQGEETISRLTVPVLKQSLKGKFIRGQEWRAGNKKKDELIRDFRDFLGLMHVATTSAAFNEGQPALSQPSRSSFSIAQLGDTATPPSSIPAGGEPVSIDRYSSGTPAGAVGATPEALPTMRPPGLSASPGPAAGSAELGPGCPTAHSVPPILTVPVLPSDAGEPGSPGSRVSSRSSSPMQQLLALNPFAKHARSRSELAPMQLWASTAAAGGGSSTSSHGSHSQPATPSAVGAAALLERSAACMQRAAEMKNQINTSILKSSKFASSVPSSAATTPTSEAALGPAAGSGRSSPSRLLGWMGLKPRGTPSPAAATMVDIAVDASAATQYDRAASPLPLGSSNGHSAPIPNPAVGSSAERENAPRLAGSKGVGPALSFAALARATSGNERQLQPAALACSPNKLTSSRSAPNSARPHGSPGPRIWK